MKKIETPPAEFKLECRKLFWMGWNVAEISNEIGVAYGTIDSWKRREKWDKASPYDRALACAELRYNQLLLKETKSDNDYVEMDRIGKQMERCARMVKFEATGKESDLNPKIKKRNEGKQSKKNLIPDEEAVKLQDDFYDNLFQYQQEWYEAKTHRTRNILKSRQIGATWYFAREAFMDALETGDNQIFLSASKSQAQIFRFYIVDWVRQVTGVELKGDPLVLPNGANIYFLSTNSKTAQGYHGHMYNDEYFWIGRFADFQKVSSGMAMHKKWRKTYFSTPSTLNHEAYPFWSGKHFNEGRPRSEHIELDLSHEALKNGRLCEDGQWRQIVTVLDAVEKGCDLFDINQLKLEYSPDSFNHLLMCEFVDDAASVFNFKNLARCFVDIVTDWKDFEPHKKRPFGDKPVWIGYDPSRSRDDASLVVIAPPSVHGGKYRILEVHSYSNYDFRAQAKEIKKMCGRYNVTKIAIDNSGIGQGVYELVKEFYPRVHKITYNLEIKSRLVLKAKDVIDSVKLVWDASLRVIPAAFMTIKKTITSGGGKTTFKATRTNETGHADIAWAVMHAFFGEDFGPLDGGVKAKTSSVEIF